MISKRLLLILKQDFVELSTFHDFHPLYRGLNALNLHKNQIQNACSNSTN